MQEAHKKPKTPQKNEDDISSIFGSVGSDYHANIGRCKDAIGQITKGIELFCDEANKAGLDIKTSIEKDPSKPFDIDINYFAGHRLKWSEHPYSLTLRFNPVSGNIHLYDKEKRESHNFSLDDLPAVAKYIVTAFKSHIDVPSQEKERQADRPKTRTYTPAWPPII